MNAYNVGIVNSGPNWFCVKTNANGSIKWNVQGNGMGFNSGASGVCTDGPANPQNNVYVCGTYNSNMTTGPGAGLTYMGGTFDGFLVKLDSNGNKIWDIALHGTGNDVPAYCAMDFSGHLWVSGGYTGSPTYGTITLPASGAYTNLFLAEIDPASGTVLNVYAAANAGNSSNAWGGNGNSLVIDSCNNIYYKRSISGYCYMGHFLGCQYWCRS